VIKNTSSQNSFPGAIISQIDKASLMTIKFNTTMKIPKNIYELKNETMLVEESLKPVLEISVIPGK
jgi:hypothetical protein